MPHGNHDMHTDATASAEAGMFGLVHGTSRHAGFRGINDMHNIADRMHHGTIAKTSGQAARTQFTACRMPQCAHIVSVAFLSATHDGR